MCLKSLMMRVGGDRITLFTAQTGAGLSSGCNRTLNAGVRGDEIALIFHSSRSGLIIYQGGGAFQRISGQFVGECGPLLIFRLKVTGLESTFQSQFEAIM